MQRTRSDAVRRDVFSVVADERDGAGWVYVYMTTSRQKALARTRQITNDHSLGLNRLAKLVHPRQFVVDAFVAAGNEIDAHP